MRTAKRSSSIAPRPQRQHRDPTTTIFMERNLLPAAAASPMQRQRQQQQRTSPQSPQRGLITRISTTKELRLRRPARDRKVNCQFRRPSVRLSARPSILPLECLTIWTDRLAGRRGSQQLLVVRFVDISATIDIWDNFLSISNSLLDSQLVDGHLLSLFEF